MQVAPENGCVQVEVGWREGEGEGERERDRDEGQEMTGMAMRMKMCPWLLRLYMNRTLRSKGASSWYRLSHQILHLSETMFVAICALRVGPLPLRKTRSAVAGRSVGSQLRHGGPHSIIL